MTSAVHIPEEFYEAKVALSALYRSPGCKSARFCRSGNCKCARTSPATTTISTKMVMTSAG
jgi:hypothetical protein